MGCVSPTDGSGPRAGAESGGSPSRRRPPPRARVAPLLDALRAQARSAPAGFGLDPIPEPVLEAMARVPREPFVPPELETRAYDNTALPIGSGQTISQPYIVALMTQLACVEPGDRVLDVGTGSGYQAAVLAELGAEVVTVERIPELARAARARLARLGYGWIDGRTADATQGLPDVAPFAAIVVAAATPDVPPALIEQLAPGGRLVIPLGASTEGQRMTVVRKHRDGTTTREGELPVAFVPLVAADTDP